MHSTNLTLGHDQHGTPNALYDGLSRVVVSFPTDRTHDTRRGSPSTPETIKANAQLFAAADDMQHALRRIATDPTAIFDGPNAALGDIARAALAKATA